MYPFDHNKLNVLLDEQGIDLLLVTTKHNTRYLTGGYYNHFHERLQRMATTRYLSVLGIAKGRFDEAFFISGHKEAKPMVWHNSWVPHHHLTGPKRSPFFQNNLTASKAAAELARKMGFAAARIGIELPFLPADAYITVRSELPNATFVDATLLLGELRAVKSEAELNLIRCNADNTVAAFQTTFASGTVGMTTAELTRCLQTELMQQGIEMQWILIAMGPDGVERKGPSERAWQPNEVLRLDSGSALNDYLVDLCRMGCLGEPSKLAQEFHKNCLHMNDTLIKAIKPGMLCGELYTLGQHTLEQMSFAEHGFQITHGIGLVPHEPPTIVAGSDRLLEEGMVMSIESEFQHPEVGDVKIEDMVTVTVDGCEPLGHSGREWQIV